MSRILVIACFALFFSGCISKSVKAPNIYELSTESCAKNPVKIGIISSSSALKTRSILLKADNEIVPLKDAKFISFGEDMIESALVKFFMCKEGDKNTKTLNANLTEFYATKEKVVISLGVGLDDKVAFFSASSHTGSYDEKVIINAFNLALEKLLVELDDFVLRNRK